MGGNPADSVSRRSFVKYSGAAGVTGALAGCSSNGGDGGDGSDGGDGGDGGSGGGGDGSDGGDAPDEVIIGSNHPLSGALSNTGERMDHQAVRLAAMMKNESGGIESLDGAELSVISGDNEGAQELGGEVAQELIDDGASVLTGCYSSPVTSAATRTSESAGVPFVISVSVANSILRETQLNYAYRPQPPADQMAIDHARLLADTIRNAGEEIETAGLFYIDISFGQSIRDALRGRSSRRTTSRSSPRPPTSRATPQTRRSRRSGTRTPTPSSRPPTGRGRSSSSTRWTTRTTSRTT